jgi:hypothetical protein
LNLKISAKLIWGFFVQFGWGWFGGGELCEAVWNHLKIVARLSDTLQMLVKKSISRKSCKKHAHKKLLFLNTLTDFQELKSVQKSTRIPSTSLSISN